MGQASSWSHKILGVKKLSCAKASASVLSLLLISSVKSVTHSSSPGCNLTSHPSAARPEVSHQVRYRISILTKSFSIPMLFHAHSKSELLLLSSPFLSSPSVSVELRRNLRITWEDSVSPEQKR